MPYKDRSVRLAFHRKYWLKYKQQMLDAYGHVCQCCGVVGDEFLTLEHIKHDGEDHRKKCGSTWEVYKDLEARGWPKDGSYTVLCWNCNCVTRFGNPCPHKERLHN